MFKIFKCKNKDDLKEELGKYVEKYYGKEYVEEALQDYDTLNEGGVIGDVIITAAFLNLIEEVKNGLN